MYGCGRFINNITSFNCFVSNHFFLDMNYTTPPPLPCKNGDGDADCTNWADAGDCTSEEWETYMYMNCKLACDMCDA